MTPRSAGILKALDAWIHRILWRIPILTWPVRLVSTAAYVVLQRALGRWHPHVRFVQDLRSIRPPESGSRADGGERVLFFTVRGWFAHVGTEAILSSALRLRGIDAVHYVCGGVLPQCDFKPSTDPYVVAPTCRRCKGLALEAYGGVGGKVVTFDAVSDFDHDLARSHVENLQRDELLRFRYHDLPLGDWVMPSVQRSLLRGDVPDDRRSRAILRGFLETAILTVEGVGRLLDRTEPTRVILTNGTFLMERVALELATRRGIEVIAYERGTVPNSVILSKDKPVVPFDLDADWSTVRDVALSTDQVTELTSYLDARATGRATVQPLSQGIGDDNDLHDLLGLDRTRPITVLFTNVLWDTAVFERDIGFSGMHDWIVEAVRTAASNPRLQLVIRVHPAEVRLTMLESRDTVVDRLAKAYGALPSNVTLVPPGSPLSSYALMDIASQVAVYTSTTGLEAAIRGHRVLVSGNAHYAGKGFTMDVGGPAQFQRALAEDPPAPTPAEVELALRYGYLFFRRFARPFPWLRDRGRSDRSLEVSALADLRPGADKRLDALCEALLGRASLIAEPGAWESP